MSVTNAITQGRQLGDMVAHATHESMETVMDRIAEADCVALRAALRRVALWASGGGDR